MDSVLHAGVARRTVTLASLMHWLDELCELYNIDFYSIVGFFSCHQVPMELVFFCEEDPYNHRVS